MALVPAMSAATVPCAATFSSAAAAAAPETTNPAAAAAGGGGRFTVVRVPASATHAVRLAVLRKDTVSKAVAFAEDEWPGAVHLGVADAEAAGGEIVAVSSWIPREAPHGCGDDGGGARGVQLRGMATVEGLQGRGLGGLLLEAGVAAAAGGGAGVVWANARDAALPFYLRHGFAVAGAGFIESVTGLPHHVIVRQLLPAPAAAAAATAVAAATAE